MSNAWVLNPLHDHFLRKYVVHQAGEAIKELFANPDKADEQMMGKSAEQIINEGDKETARLVLQFGGITSPKAFRENALKGA